MANDCELFVSILAEAKYKVDNISETVEGQVLQITNDLDKVVHMHLVLILHNLIINHLENYDYSKGNFQCMAF